MKISAIKLGSAISALALIFSAQSSFAQNFYKWVDANGSTHYTAAPPPKSAQKKGKIETYGWKNSSPAAPVSQGEVQPVVAEAAQEAQKAVDENEQVHQDAQRALLKGQESGSEAR